MAAARRLPSELVPVIATQSLGAPIARQEGFATEYVMSFRVANMTRNEWSQYLFRRFRHLIDVYEPAAIVYDGVVPYAGMTRAWTDARISTAWLRRGLWRRGLGTPHIKLGHSFDVIIQPGEIAGEVDSGATSYDLGRTRAIPPVTYLDRTELETASTARQYLGHGDKPLALISLGAGNINDTTSDTSRAIAAVKQRGFQPILAVSPITERPPTVEGVPTVSVYPLSKYLNAFEFVVGAAGYNSVHEYLMAGIPSVLVPNTATGLDDQVLRGRYAERRGLALTAESARELERAIDIFSDKSMLEGFRSRLRAMNLGNGAKALASAVSELAGLEERG